MGGSGVVPVGQAEDGLLQDLSHIESFLITRPENAGVPQCDAVL